LAKKSRVRDFCETNPKRYGVFDHGGVLKAYARHVLW
jgi:hypothetical protein